MYLTDPRLSSNQEVFKNSQFLKVLELNSARGGRKTVIDVKLISEVKHLKQQKMLSVTQIVKITGRSRNTIYKVLKNHLR
jgi:predicted transcriptional regulator